jgi:UDP-glucose 4-epimerase
LQCCIQNKIKKIIFASSAAIYGDSKEIPIKENSVASPVSPYGESKLNAEKIIQDTCKQNNINYTILRMFNVYGKGQNDQYAGVITKFVQNILQKKPILIYGDGTQTRDFISIYDVVNAFECSMLSKKNGTYNIASGKSISINELSKMMFDIFGNKPDVTYENAKKGDIKNSVADVSLSEIELGFVVKRSLKKELSSIYHE